jgi:hypothetical protein
LTDYRAFLESKFKFSHDSGFDVPLNAVNPICKPHQRDAIVWALRKGRAAIFFRFGLGKTLIQTEILRLIHEREGGRHLVIAPLGIRQEFKHDAAELLGLGRDFYTFIRRSDEVTRDGLYITNYESVRDGSSTSISSRPSLSTKRAFFAAMDRRRTRRSCSCSVRSNTASSRLRHHHLIATRS